VKRTRKGASTSILPQSRCASTVEAPSGKEDLHDNLQVLRTSDG